MRGLFVAIGLLGAAMGVANAECHIAASTVIMCQAADNAALAYQAYGLNVKKINTSYTREVLHRSFCATVTDPKRTISFGQIGTGRIATPDGWVDIAFVGWLNDGLADTRFVARKYLQGTCSKIRLSDLHSDPEAVKRNPSMPTIVNYSLEGL